jgi:cation:H+ antiporter
MDFKTALALITGLTLLLLGAEGLVRGGAALARRLRVSALVVGLTVVAFGTSTPELVVSIKAALLDAGDIALGNVVGSNIANVLLILGIAAIIRPLRVKAQVIRIDIPIMIGVSVLALPILMNGRVSRVEGLGLLAGIACYTILSVVLARRETEPAVLTEYDRALSARPRSLGGQIVAILLGLSMLAIGSDLFVRGAVALATAVGYSEAFIGLTVVAVGTSLPELFTSVVAAARGESDIAVGNVVGSNIFNLLAILGTSALLRPIQAAGVSRLDYLVMLVAALVLLPFAWSKLRLSRWEALVLLAAYAAYLYLR